MVYGKHMSRGRVNEFVIVIAPSERAFAQFAANESNDNPGSITVRVNAKSRAVQDFGRLPDVIHVREDGSRDFERGAPVREREHWANHV